MVKKRSKNQKSNRPQKSSARKKPVSKKKLGIGIVVVLMAVVWFGWDYGPFDNKNIPNAEGLPPRTPRLTVSEDVIDFGKVNYNTMKLFSFKLTNSGNDILKFRQYPNIDVLEGCWPPSLTIGSMVLKPGESTKLLSSNFTMHEGMDGPHDFAIHLLTNDPAQPDKVVHVLSDWVP